MRVSKMTKVMLTTLETITITITCEEVAQGAQYIGQTSSVMQRRWAAAADSLMMSQKKRTVLKKIWKTMKRKIRKKITTN